MKTQQFIDLLRQAPNKNLVFANREGATIRPGYHLTELKAASFDAVDCGGQKNQWNETIVQLWVPENNDEDEFMAAGKFLSIYDKVTRVVSLDCEAEVKFEYGDENFFPSNYAVAGIEQDARTIRVDLIPPQTTCKARDRRLTGAAKECCC